MNVAYQGEPGAYSERAVRGAFPDADPMPCDSVRLVFSRVTSGEAAFGVVPLENSQAGSVNETYDLLQHTSLLQIVGEVVARVDHALLGVPGARLEEIRRARSHWQALAQCEEFLSSMRIEPIPVHDTAGAARLIAESGARDEAAIASVGAAANFGLAVLAERIQTEKENFTKFAILGTGDPGLGPDRQDLDGVGGAGRARVPLGRAASVRGARDQPAQTGITTEPRQTVRVRDVRRRHGVGR